MRDNTSRKKIAAVVVAILVILYMGPLVGVSLAAVAGLAGEGITGVLPFLLMYALIGGAVIVGVLLALAQRLKEIDGGEEEDAKKYWGPEKPAEEGRSPGRGPVRIAPGGVCGLLHRAVLYPGPAPVGGDFVRGPGRSQRTAHGGGAGGTETKIS